MDANTGHRFLVVITAGLFLAFVAVLFLTSDASTDSGLILDPAVQDRRTDVEIEAFMVVPVDPDSVYDPVRAGEETPRTYRQLLQRDQIEPVYDPSFTDASGVDWPDEMLVIGVDGVTTAKAYPVTHLNSREMVNDEIDGDPILVSW